MDVITIFFCFDFQKIMSNKYEVEGLRVRTNGELKNNVVIIISCMFLSFSFTSTAPRGRYTEPLKP
jgi:hypothetical protein